LSFGFPLFVQLDIHRFARAHEPVINPNGIFNL